MLLYVNGDSHLAATYQYPGSDISILQQYELSFAGLLAKKYNLDYINEAWPGGSNNRIIRTSKEFLKDKDPENTLVLIGWTTFERTEWYIDGIWHQICGEPLYEYNLRSNILPPGFDIKRWHSSGTVWSTLSNMWSNYTNRTLNDLEETGNIIFSSRALEFQYYFKEFSEWLTERNFKHMFLHTHDAFMLDDFLKNDWNNDVWLFNDPYNLENSFTSKSKELGHKPDNWNHFSPEAHKDYADFIEQEFVNKLLK